MPKYTKILNQIIAKSSFPQSCVKRYFKNLRLSTMGPHKLSASSRQSLVIFQIDSYCSW